VVNKLFKSNTLKDTSRFFPEDYSCYNDFEDEEQAKACLPVDVKGGLIE
jgi:hypothetical protein